MSLIRKAEMVIRHRDVITQVAIGHTYGIAQLVGHT